MGPRLMESELLKPGMRRGVSGRVSSTTSPGFQVRWMRAKVPGVGAG